jgi:hypothetical protein
LDLLVFHWFKVVQPGMLVGFIFGVYAVFSFMLWVSSKILCATLVICLILVAVRSGAPDRIRVVTILAGLGACGLLLYWSSVISHSW